MTKHLSGSKIIRVRCTGAGGKRCTHRVKLMADGQLALLDHERNEPKQALQWCALSGVTPKGCYAALYMLQTGKRLGWIFDERPIARPGTYDALAACHSAVESCRAVKAALRAPSFYALRMGGRARGATWVATSSPERAHTLAACGEPAWFALWGGSARFVANHGGFVKAGCARGAILWDVTLPGVNGLVVNGVDSRLPGPLALLRLTERLLDGWLGLLVEV